MTKKKKSEFKIGYNELKNGCPVGDNVLDVKNTPIPIESLKVLMTGDSNQKFRVLSKKINSENVKVVLKHRETNEKLKTVITDDNIEIVPDVWKFDLRTFYPKAEGGMLPDVYAAPFTEVDKLLDGGYITPAAYVKRLPFGAICDRRGLLEELEHSHKETVAQDAPKEEVSHG